MIHYNKIFDSCPNKHALWWNYTNSCLFLLSFQVRMEDSSARWRIVFPKFEYQWSLSHSSRRTIRCVRFVASTQHWQVMVIWSWEHSLSPFKGHSTGSLQSTRSIVPTRTSPTPPTNFHSNEVVEVWKNDTDRRPIDGERLIGQVPAVTTCNLALPRWGQSILRAIVVVSCGDLFRWGYKSPPLLAVVMTYVEGSRSEITELCISITAPRRALSQADRMRDVQQYYP